MVSFGIPSAALTASAGGIRLAWPAAVRQAENPTVGLFGQVSSLSRLEFVTDMACASTALGRLGVQAGVSTPKQAGGRYAAWRARNRPRVTGIPKMVWICGIWVRPAWMVALAPGISAELTSATPACARIPVVLAGVWGPQFS